MIRRELTLGETPTKHYPAYVCEAPYAPYEPLVVLHGTINKALNGNGTTAGPPYRDGDEMVVPQKCGLVNCADLRLSILAHYTVRIDTIYGSPVEDILADYAAQKNNDPVIDGIVIDQDTDKV